VLQFINALSRESYGADAPAVILAILDTGVALDLIPKEFRGDGKTRILIENALDFAEGVEEQTTHIRDLAGHGTAVMGIACATNLALGVDPRCKILPLRVATPETESEIDTPLPVDEMSAAAAIRHAVHVASEAKTHLVINCSFVFTYWTALDERLRSRKFSAIAEAVEFAQTKGAVVVAAAGND